MKSFSDFTNQYSLSKTLRFELVPDDRTLKLLQEEKIFAKDEDIKKKYDATKPYFDKLHREFVIEALDKVALSMLDEYFRIYTEWKKRSNTDEKKLKSIEAKLRNEVKTFFDDTARKWADKHKGLKLKKRDIDLLFEEAVFKILKEKYRNDPKSRIRSSETEEEMSVFDSWKGFVGYFGKFFKTRRNFYDDKGKASAIPTRIVDQNLRRFCDNILLFQSLKDRIDFNDAESLKTDRLEDIFALDHYNTCLLQSGIDRYNKIIGGWTEDSGNKIKGLNELINLHRQKTSEKLPFFKPLDRQILSEKQIFLNEIEDNTHFQKGLNGFRVKSAEKIEIMQKLVGDFVKNNDAYDLSRVYLRSEALNTISYKWTSETVIFKEALYKTLKKYSDKSRQAKQEEEDYKFPDFVALSDIREALSSIDSDHFWKDRYYDEKLFSERHDIWDQFLLILHFEFQSLLQNTMSDQEVKPRKVGYKVYESQIRSMLSDYNDELDMSAKQKALVKNYADSVLKIHQMAQYFAVEKKRNWLPGYELDVFYTDQEFGYLKYYDQAYEEIVKVYNKLRNYLTKKLYSEEKWKLNFEKTNLLNGFTESRTEKSNGGTQYGAYLLRKKENNGKYSYYLAISKNPQLFNKTKQYSGKELSGYERYDYYGAKIDSIYGSSYDGNYQKDKIELEPKVVIEKIKNSVAKYVDKIPQFSEIEKTEYKDLEEIRKKIAEIVQDYGRILSPRQLYKEEFDEALTSQHPLYFFRISNKDLKKDTYPKSFRITKKENLHTLYLREIMTGKVNNFDIGSGELFFRPSTTSLNKDVDRKRSRNIDIIKYKRYTEDKILFHWSILLNPSAEKKNSKGFNQVINSYLSQNKNVNIIGIDRGEKHLAYFTVINQKGEILERGSLNEPNGKDYYSLLKKRAEDREQARKDWQSVEQIKDLKKGYISQVVKVIADLAVKHNAIIVLEDLNMRFKQIRGGIEKSVYQQLEKALIDKFGYLVMKDEKNPIRAGHVLIGYQLTAPFESFQKMGKQTGIIFYTQAAYTSRIDPKTGWRPNIYLKYKSAKQSQSDFSKFHRIEFKHGHFEFTYNLKNFYSNNKNLAEKTCWTVSSHVERFYWDRKENNNKGGYKHYKDGAITEQLIKSFEAVGIDYSNNILKQIQKLDCTRHASFFKSLVFLFKLICQIRNTQQDKGGNENDFILSPVEPYFDSRKSDGNLPMNGDENGAYNIARKGIIILKNIKQESSWKDLYISSKQWDDFAQNTS